MGEYRHNETGEVKSQGEWRKHYKNVSFPRKWTAATLESLKLDAVVDVPAPTVGIYEIAKRDGAVKDAKGDWASAWAVWDRFSSTTDEDGVTTTKAEHEAAYQASMDDAAGEDVRTKRNTLLAKTDYFALTDVTMSATMVTYRQALRDITDHASFPNLVEADWPVEA